MATFGTIKNTLNCGLTALGTGVKHCPFEIKLISGIYAVKRNTQIADLDTFDKDYLQGLVQAGTAIPLINDYNTIFFIREKHYKFLIENP